VTESLFTDSHALSECSHLATTWFASDGEEEFEFGWQLVLCVESVGEVDSSDTAVGVDLNSIKSGGGLVRDDDDDQLLANLFHDERQR